MNFENAKYYKKVSPHNVNELQNIKATVDGVKVNIPLDPANRHYAAILEWAKIDGNKIEEAD